MSFTSFFTVGLAVLATGASALLAPTTQLTGGEAVLSPNTKTALIAGQKNTITWSPDVKGNVALVLLIGPSTNVVPFLTIAENIPNSGSFVWTPSSDMVAASTTGYGIQLIMQTGEQAGEYQYSTQFGIENKDTSVDYQTLLKKAQTFNNNEGFYKAHSSTPATDAGAGAGAGTAPPTSEVKPVQYSSESLYNVATILPVSSKPASAVVAYSTASAHTFPAPVVAYGNNATIAALPTGSAVAPASHAPLYKAATTLSSAVAVAVTPATASAVAPAVATPPTASYGSGASTGGNSSSPIASFTGAGSQLGASVGGLVFAAAFAVLAL